MHGSSGPSHPPPTPPHRIAYRIMIIISFLKQKGRVGGGAVGGTTDRNSSAPVRLVAMEISRGGRGRGRGGVTGGVR